MPANNQVTVAGVLCVVLSVRCDLKHVINKRFNHLRSLGRSLRQSAPQFHPLRRCWWDTSDNDMQIWRDI